MRRAPSRRWRTLPSDGNCRYADSETEVIKKAREQAQELGTSVHWELWSEDHPQDDLNQGWASCGTVEYIPPDQKQEVWTLVVMSQDGRGYHGTSVHRTDEAAIAALRTNYDPEGDLADKKLNVIERFEEYFLLDIRLENHTLED